MVGLGMRVPRVRLLPAACGGTRGKERGMEGYSRLGRGGGGLGVFFQTRRQTGVAEKLDFLGGKGVEESCHEWSDR